MASQSLLLLSKRITWQPKTTPLSLLRSQPVDESIMREQVLSTHNYDGDGTNRDLNTNSILGIAQNILGLIEMGTAQEAKVEKLINKLEEDLNCKQVHCFIRQLSFEIAVGLNALNLHSTIIGVLSMLSCYSWEDKMVLMMAAFSIIYGEFSLVSRLRKRNGLGQKLANLKQSRPIPTPKEVIDCINSVLELTKCVVELKQWRSYFPPQSIIFAIPMASYWIGTSVVYIAACAYGAQFRIQHQLVELTASIANILATFSPELAKKKAEESFEALRNAFDHNSSNKLEVLRLMFNVKDDDEVIFHWGDFKRGLNSIWNDRLVLLLITSDLDISNKMIRFLNWFHATARPYIIWIPITHNDAPWTGQQYEKLREGTEFYWLNDPPKMLLPQFTRFAKEILIRWGEEPILVSLDQRGRIVHPNVMHMILTWHPTLIQKNTLGVKGLANIITPSIQKQLVEGSSGINRVVPEIYEMINDLVRGIDAKISVWTNDVENRIQNAIAQSTPYDSEREKYLWQQETAWSLHLIMATQFDHYQYTTGELIRDWIQEEKYIFLYGGNNIKWVRDFISKICEVGSKTQSNIEMAYVGKNEMIRTIIDKERMSHCPLHNSAKIWWFWTRLRSMFLSRIRYLNVPNHSVKEAKDDEILQGLKKLLAYEGNNTRIEGWALLSKGSKVIVCGHGSKMLRALNDYKIWKENITTTRSFGQAFKDHHEMLVSSSSSPVNSHSCCALEYPATLSKIPESELCPECSRRMHKFLTFTCCHGHA